MTATTEAKTPVPALSLSANAAARIASLLAAQGKSPAEYALRVGVQSGGCSGLSYVFNLDQPKPGDLVVARDGARMVCDPKSILYLEASELDYVDSLQAAGFVWKNPNVKGSCGCGTSFSV
jgi:iron-sulfur cluster assembly protein